MNSVAMADYIRHTLRVESKSRRRAAHRKILLTSQLVWILHKQDKSRMPAEYMASEHVWAHVHARGLPLQAATDGRTSAVSAVLLAPLKPFSGSAAWSCDAQQVT